MATLALGALGAAAGGALLPGGIGILGATISGAAIGSQIGSLIGARIDQALFASSGQSRAVDGPRLDDLRVTGSSEGAPIPRLFGRARVGGQVIWATNLVEEAVTTEAGGGGKGGRPAASPAGVDYRYFANFAVGLCEGPITSIGRVWADDRELDLSAYSYRLYTGEEDQAPDALIEAMQGVGNAPAYRGLAYLVFERLPLAAFGNRVPQLSFEVFRSVDASNALVRGVCLIPGSGEFVYSPSEVDRVVGRISQVAENVNTRSGSTDWVTSLGQLEASLPNANSVSLVVSWFGTDLRAGHCQLRPGVESLDKVTTPQAWSVAGLSRASAHLVSSHEGRAAYGGTPSDRSVVAAIRDLRDRGKSVVLSPFVLMDVPHGNALADPYTGAATQAAYPWRGRITLSPAAGQPGSPDKTPAAASQIAAFTGTALPSQFTISGDDVAYSGPAEWSFRRFILHYAHLAAVAGGVDAFVLCSELRGLTTARDGAHSYPFVSTLATLAGEVRAILGPSTKLLYAADWSEYFGHQPADGSGDAHFHLDPLWSSTAIDAIGIDLYWPLADWRDGHDHLDALAGIASIYDLDYLKANLSAGEGYDWYYASSADRAAQVRTPITDGLGKPWMFRFKDLRGWWQNVHHNRTGGVESSVATAWTPQSKPIWLMEIGCPAVDKGANQPNVFIDPKSSESFLPYHSSGARDDYMQRRLLQAINEAFDPDHAGYVPGLNPVSALYGGRMVDPARIHVYCWDARPFPAFPNRTRLWGDGVNWPLGHWLNGRTSAVPLSALVAAMLELYDFHDFDVGGLSGCITGYVIDRIMSARDALQPLELAGFFDSLESDGRIAFRSRGQTPPVLSRDEGSMVEDQPGSDLLRMTRGQETDLPGAAKIGFISGLGDYERSIAEARRQATTSARVSMAELPITMEPEQAVAIAETWLYETWIARERLRFALPPSALAIEPGDLVTLEVASRELVARVTEVADRGARQIEALAIDPDLYRLVAAPSRPVADEASSASGPPLACLLDVPPTSGDAPHRGLVAVAQLPWPGTVAVYRSAEEAAFNVRALVTRPATTGLTDSALPPGPHWRIDRFNTVDVVIDRGTLRSVTRLQLLGGANAAAIEVAPGAWEVVQFETAALIGAGRYRLSGLLRGQRGTEVFNGDAIAAGARFVLLDEAITTVDMTADDVGLPYFWRIGPASRDVGDRRYMALTHTFQGAGLSPLAPVHVTAARTALGDVTVTWKRRTRVSGDSWDPVEVPLGEERELYEVEVLDGATVVRTVTADTSSTTITAAMQIEDFGGLQPALSIRIFQVAAGYGRGRPRLATV